MRSEGGRLSRLVVVSAVVLYSIDRRRSLDILFSSRICIIYLRGHVEASC